MFQTCGSVGMNPVLTGLKDIHLFHAACCRLHRCVCSALLVLAFFINPIRVSEIAKLQGKEYPE